MLSNLTKNLVLWLVIAMVLMAIFKNFTPSDSAPTTELKYSAFLQDVKQGRVDEVLIDGRTITGIKSDGSRFIAYSPDDPKLVDDLVSAGVTINAKKRGISLVADAAVYQLVSASAFDRRMDFLHASDARWRARRT